MVRFLMVVQFLQPLCPGALPYPQGPENREDTSINR
jgi:hypothetical protein